MDTQNIDWSLNVGAHPPVAEAPMPPTVVANRSAEVTQPAQGRRFKRIRRAATVSGVVLLAGASTAAYAVTRGGGNSAEDFLANRTGSAEIEGSDFNACEDGMFPEGDFQASLEISTPGDLHRNTGPELNSANELTSYFFGKDGVACESAATLATIKQGYLQMLGDGAAERYDFASFGTVKEQIDIYQGDKEVAKEDANKLAGFMEANSELNNTEIVSSFYMVKGVKVGDEVEPRLEKVDVNFAKESVFITVLANDGSFENVQIMAIDRKSKQVYLLHANGTIPEMTEDEKKAQQENQEDQTGGGNGEELSPGGGDNENEHNGDTNGCGPGEGCGTGGADSGGPGGSCGTGECGGCGSCNPTTPTTPGVGGPQPTSPTTVYVPPVTNPPYVPPVVTTVPPPPTTAPPTTAPPTTLPKGPEPSTPGAPNGVEVINGVQTEIVDGQVYVTVHPNKAQ